MTDAQRLETDVWHPSVQQAAFRQVMQAYARPGMVQRLPADAQMLALATLLDGATSLADPDRLLGELETARLETRNAAPEVAQFVLVRGNRPPAFQPAIGTLESPDHGATVLLVVESLGDGQPLRLSGPGVDGVLETAVGGLDPAWLEAREVWNAAFPLGVEMLLLAQNDILALPRTTRIEGFQTWVM